MTAITIYTSKTSTRLVFVLDWLFKEQLQVDYSIVTKAEDISPNSFVISYGQPYDGALSLPDAGLLWQSGVKEVHVNNGTWNKLPVFFYNSSGSHPLPFDIFSAIFFLLSRYEEYYTYAADNHNRYPATESILYKNGVLDRPIVDEWVHALRLLLADSYKIQLPPAKSFTFQPTYDIDIAYSYRHKGFKRIAGGYFKDLLKGNINEVKKRTAVLSKKEEDPYDSFEFLKRLHLENSCKPIYFVLAALSTTAYDKNNPVDSFAMTRLVRQLHAEGTIGAHPSYYCNRVSSLLSQEKHALISITKNPVIISRQHYIKVKLPHTYKQLIANSISSDYSMGYPTHLGFRAGTSHSFLWYNPKSNSVTKLRVYPFCFMDTTAKFELNLPCEEAFEKLIEMVNTLRLVNGKLITVFHNFSLGTSDEWEGWGDAYKQFVEKQCAIF